MPRREYTTRADYDVTGCFNRHTIMPTGWGQEQDNTEIVLAEDGGVDRVLVREVGLNTYDRMGEGIAAGEAHDFTAGCDYWSKTDAFWADVREAWDARLAEGPVTLKAKVDDKTFWQHMSGYADRLADGERDEADVGESFIEATLGRFTVHPPVAQAHQSN